MRTISSFLAGSCLALLVVLTASNQASAQVPEPSAKLGKYARRPPVYPDIRLSQFAYHRAVRYGLAPVLPPPVTRWQDGHGIYGAPYYAYPRPPLGQQGYGGFSGADPNAYRAVIPPPIPPVIPTAPMPPESTAESIPTPPSDPAPK
jgi:hypothetical protein